LTGQSSTQDFYRYISYCTHMASIYHTLYTWPSVFWHHVISYNKPCWQKYHRLCKYCYVL